MITRDWVRMMAAYNSEMNRRIYRASERIPDAARRADRGAFFGSLHGTLSHLVWGDHAWMARFAGWQRIEGTIPQSPHLFDSWEALRAARVKADAGIEAWAETVDEAWLRGPLTWVSGTSGKQQTKPAWVAVTHFFNHQTHHRGQAHCLITQQGVKPEDTDLPWAVDLAALGLAA
ncbi:MAG TPA: DinB family protein [Acetobacteraceae bacterium]|nr:DinB family protein [Acetobacteraceae bacterium]